jgi:hypothetical protein
MKRVSILETALKKDGLDLNQKDEKKLEKEYNSFIEALDSTKKR